MGRGELRERIGWGKLPAAPAARPRRWMS